MVLQDNVAFLKDHLSEKNSSPTRQECPHLDKPIKNGHLPPLSNEDVSRATAGGQQVEVTPDRCENHEDELTVQPREEEEEPARMEEKRRKESGDDDDDDARLMKRFCFEPPPALMSPLRECEAAEIEEIDVETVSLSDEEEPLLRDKLEIRGGDAEENPGESHVDEDEENLSDEIIDVDGESSDKDDSRDTEMFRCLNGTAVGLSCFSEAKPLVSLPPEEMSPDSTGCPTDDRDDNIDVIGWTGGSEGEDEIDVVNENIGYTSTLFSKDDLVDRKCNTEVLLH